MPIFHKKIAPGWGELIIGILVSLVGGAILLSINPDPKRDVVRFFLEVAPFIFVLILGLLLSWKAIRQIKKGNEPVKADSLDVATNIMIGLTGVGLFMFLIPYLFLLVIGILWKVNP